LLGVKVLVHSLLTECCNRVTVHIGDDLCREVIFSRTGSITPENVRTPLYCSVGAFPEGGLLVQNYVSVLRLSELYIFDMLNNLKDLASLSLDLLKPLVILKITDAARSLTPKSQQLPCYILGVENR